MKIVINRCYGGFSLSDEAILRYAEIKGINLTRVEDEDKFWSYFIIDGDKDKYFSDRELPRNDLVLVQVVEELGAKANGQCAKLRIIEIPDETNWQIGEYDGMEHVEQVHQRWY